MFLALREFKHARLRYALVTGVIVMVASLVFILSGLANGLASGNSEAIEAIDADAYVVAEGSEFLLDRSRLSGDVVSAVQETDGIEDAQPLSASAGNVRNGDSDDVLGVSIMAVPPDTFLDPGASSGDSLADAPDGIVIDQSLENEGIEVGDTLTFDPSGLELEVVGTISGHQYRLAPTLFVNLEQMAEINPESNGAVNAVAVQGDGDSIDALPDNVDGIMVGSETELIESLPGYQEQALTLNLIQGFLIVIAAGIIAAFFFILTLQKMGELGVMKALGATTTELAKALIIQAVMLGALGILIGVGAGYIMQIVAQGTVPYQLDWMQILIYGGLILLVAVIGTLLSLFRIARVDPLDAINKAG